MGGFLFITSILKWNSFKTPRSKNVVLDKLFEWYKKEKHIKMTCFSYEVGVEGFEPPTHCL